MTAQDYRRIISLRRIGTGRDAAPVLQRGLCGGYTASCRSTSRGSWLESAEYPSETEALGALLALCIAEGSIQRHEVKRHCPLFDGRPATLFGG